MSGLFAGYGAVPVVSDVGLQVGAGEVVAVVGPNGAGKSTLLKALTGQLRILAGDVALQGHRVTGFPAERLAKLGLGYVPQLSDVFETMTVLENLQMGGYLLPGQEVAERIDDVLHTFPLLAPLVARTAGKLSGGERKVLALGRALILRPRILMLDEPSAKLSPQLSQIVFRDHIPAIASRGVGILLVEQKVSDALRVSDWTYVLVSGRVRITGQSQAVASRGDLSAVFLGGPQRAEAR